MNAIFLEVLIHHLPLDRPEPDRVITILVQVTREAVEARAQELSLVLPAMTQEEKEDLVGEMANGYALAAAAETWPIDAAHTLQVSHYFVDDHLAAINDRPPAYTDDYGITLWLQAVTP